MARCKYCLSGWDAFVELANAIIYKYYYLAVTYFEAGSMTPIYYVVRWKRWERFCLDEALKIARASRASNNFHVAGWTRMNWVHGAKHNGCIERASKAGDNAFDADNRKMRAAKRRDQIKPVKDTQ